MKILITGKSGFVAKYTSAALINDGHDVELRGSRDDMDLCNKDQVDELQPVDTIIHLAARSFIPDSFLKPDEFYRNNFVSTLNVLEKARKDKSHVIFLSTYVYGKPDQLPVPETHIKQPLNPYTQSKVLCEDLCESYHRYFGVPVTIFRPFNLYGPGQSGSFFIPAILKQLNEEVIELHDERPRRDFVYIDDVAEAIRLSVNKADKGFRVYNLGSGVSTPVKEVVYMLKDLAGSAARIHFSGIERSGEILDTVADISLANKELGWTPVMSLQEGLQKVVGYKNN